MGSKISGFGGGMEDGDMEIGKMKVRRMVSWFDSRGCNMHGVQRPRNRCSVISFAREPSNLTEEVIPCRHKGHGIDPGGPTMAALS